jgi:hypothetical protein
MLALYPSRVCSNALLGDQPAHRAKLELTMLKLPGPEVLTREFHRL